MGVLDKLLGGKAKAGVEEHGRFWVTEPGFDDIGAVLRRMGAGFEFQEVDAYQIASLAQRNACEVLFVNCGASDDAGDIADAVRGFVKRGGSLYLSDWAGNVIEEAFPNILQFDQAGEVEHLECDIVDPGLQEIIGTRIKIHFDMPGWWRIRTISERTRVYLSARRTQVQRRRKFIGKGDTRANSTWVQPVVVGFSHGDGQVIYTSFHNHAQVSQGEQELLKFLVLRPILAKAAAGAAKMAEAQQCVPGREMIASLNRGQESDPYTFQASGGEGLMYVLHWTDPGTLRLTVTDPSGRLVCQQASDRPPLNFQVDSASAGQWLCRVGAVSIAHDNFPYVLTVATRKPPARPASPPAAKSPVATPVLPTPATRLWPFYLVIDCSAPALTVAPQIGEGISRLLRGLRAIAPTDSTLGVSFVESRHAGTTITPLCALNELRPINLACRGTPALGRAIQEIVNALTKLSLPPQGKAFVVFVIAAEPTDTFEESSVQLRQLIDQGRANVVAIGLGNAVSAGTVQRMGNIPLRVPDPLGGGTVRCFEWLVQSVAAILQSLCHGPGGKAMNLPSLPSEVQWIK